MSSGITPDVIPFPDDSMRWFQEALIQSSPLSPTRVRAIVRQCWRDIHNATAPVNPCAHCDGAGKLWTDSVYFPNAHQMRRRYPVWCPRCMGTGFEPKDVAHE